MAFYSGNIATQVINPQFNQSKYRSEFRLHSGGMYLSNMRLMNLGLTTNQTGVIAGNSYNIVTGSGAIVRNIYLYDGKTILDSVIDFADIQAFRNYNNLNSVNCDTAKVLNRHGLGYVYDRTPPALGTPANPSPSLPQPPLVKEFFPNCPKRFGENQETSPLGYLSLRSVFPLLQQLEFLDTELFENLRVVVEYNIEGAITNGDVTPITGSLESSVPILVVDQIMNPELIAKTRAGFKNVVWNAYEVETVVLEKLVPTVEIPSKSQSVKFRLNGFSNKTLVSLLVQKQPTDVISPSYRNHGSVALIDEAWQVVVNGSNLLPDAGVTTANYRLSLLNDSFDTLNTFPGSSGLSMYKPQNFVDGSVKINAQNQIIFDKISSLDYFGVLINQKITSLDIICGRSTKLTYDPMYAQTINLKCFGQVVKSIIKSAKGGYNVVYL